MKPPRRGIILRALGCLLAGFLTFCVVTLALGRAPDSWIALEYRRAFGLAPLLASAADANWFDGEGLVEVYPIVGARTDRAVFLGSWTLLFAAVYFLCAFRSRRTI